MLSGQDLRILKERQIYLEAISDIPSDIPMKPREIPEFTGL
jgi:hypothetical protein